MTLALLFPGQGSQFVGMGDDLATAFPAFRETLQEVDDVLGMDLSRLLREGPEEELIQTRNAQPAILAHSVATWRLVQETLGPVQHAAGHSLGEFSAWVAAGALPLADAVRLVRRRGELMFEAGKARPGTMAAVLGLEDAMVEEVCRDSSAGSETDVVVAANLNAPGQVVISGDEAAVRRAAEKLKAAGARRVIPLSVSGAFHSPLMRPAVEGLRSELESIKFERPAFPVVSNVSARPVSEPDQISTLLLEQLTSPVRWADSVSVIVASGVDRFMEIGPGSVLTGLNRRNARGVQSEAVGTLESVQALLTEEME